jgi:hypothetical protein
MAQMVCPNEYPNGFFMLPPMPGIDSKLQSSYQEMLEGRVKAFPINEQELLAMSSVEDAPLDEFQHLLRYDAESAFWLLLWWCIQAQPAKGVSSVILHAYWSILVSGDNIRESFINNFPRNCLHPSYSELTTLLIDMGRHLQGDLKFSKTKERKEPDYIHEVFQRLILNFLVTNEDKPFMNLAKVDKPRPVEDLSCPRLATAPLGKRPHGTPNEEPVERKVSVHRYQSNILVMHLPVVQQETAREIAGAHIIPFLTVTK